MITAGDYDTHAMVERVKEVLIPACEALSTLQALGECT